VMRMCVQNG